jgi:hypothetical protein
LRVHDTLLDLVQAREVGRVALEDLYLYVSKGRRKARAQMSRRRELLQPRPVVVPEPDPTVVIEVLLAFIHQPRGDTSSLEALFRKEGKAIPRQQIEAVFARYGLGKKKTPSGRWQH